MKKSIILSLTFLIAAIACVIPVFAQPTLPSAPGSAPIDGGLSLLVAAGVGYGVKKVKERNKNNKENEKI